MLLLVPALAPLLFPALAPPRVIATTPAHAQAGVDPAATDRVTIRFDRPMLVGSHSWIGAPPLFPTPAGQPAWTSPTTTELPVRLEPDHDYMLRLNSESKQGFRTPDGEPLAPNTLVFSTRPYPTTPERNRAALDTLGVLLTTRYSHRNRLGIDWAALIDEHAPALAASDSSLSLAVGLADLLARARDLHVTVLIGDLTLPTHSRIYAPNFNARVLSRLLPDLAKRTEQVYACRTPDDVGYILITSWDPAGGPGAAAIDAVRDLADTRALIIDVRPNPGGDETQAQRLSACFVDQPTVYARNDRVDAGSPSGFSGMYDRSIAPSDDAPRYLSPVYVLSGPGVVSSCEGFLLMMRAAGAHILGEPSAGASGDPKPHAIADDITVMLPSWRTYTPRGLPIEGEGVTPDTFIRVTPEDVAADDPVLRAALEMATTGRP